MKFNQIKTAITVAFMASAMAASAQGIAGADADFLNQAAQNGHAEVEASKMAESKAASAKVKTFAKQMVTDHTKANTELTALATKKGVKVPNEPSPMQKAKALVLKATSGATFDKQYAKEMGVDAHQETVALFEKASTGAADADVKAFATKTLPTLRHHLDMAKSLDRDLNGGSSK